MQILDIGDMILIKSLRSNLIIAFTGILIISLLVTTFFLGRIINKELSGAIDENALNLLDANKNLVESQYNNIKHYNETLFSVEKIEIKNKVEIAFSVIESNWFEYKNGLVTEEEAKDRALLFLKQFNTSSNIGSFWVINRKNPLPVIIMSNFLPELDGTDIENPIYNCALGKKENLIKSIVNISMKQGNGFIDYLWKNPLNGESEEPQLKMAYVKMFNSWDWIIGVSVYIDNIEKDIEERMNVVIDDINKISNRQKNRESGSFFIFNENDYMLVHPNLAGKDISRIINPVTGNYIVSDFRNAILDSKNSVEYFWDKPGSEGKYNNFKKSYITYFEPLGWYICSSTYQEYFDNILSSISRTIVLFSCFFVIIAVVLSFIISKTITKSFNRLMDSIVKTDRYGIPENIYVDTGTTEIQILSTTINNMIKSIRESRRELKNEHDFSNGIIEGSPVIINGIKPDGTVTFINSAGISTTGYTREEIESENWWNLVYPGDEYKQVDSFLEKLEEKDIANYEMTITCKDGSRKNILWNNITKRDNNREILEFIGFGIDITDHKNIKQALQESEDRSSALLKAIPDLILVMDRECHFVDYEAGINDNFNTKEYYGLPINEIFPSEVVEITRKKIHETLETGETQIYVYQLEHNELGSQYFEAHMVQSGENLVLAIIRNVTDRKKAQKNLSQQGKFLKLLLDHIPSQIFWKDLNKVYLGCNQAFAEICGIKDPDEIVGLTDNDFVIGKPLNKIHIPSKYTNHYKQIDSFVVETGEAVLNQETLFINDQGDERVSNTTKIPIRDNKNQIIGLLGICIDITEQNKSEEELLHLRNYLYSIIDSMPSILIGVDAEFQVTLWNKKSSITTGITAQEAKGQNLFKVYPQMVLEKSKIKESINTQNIIHDKKRSTESAQGDRFENITIYPLSSDEIKGAVIRIDDVTKQVHLEELVIQSEKLLSVGGLAAGMAHEINNPLAGMMQTAGVMANRLGRKMDIAANIKAAEEAGTSLDAIKKFMEARDIPKMIKTIDESGQRIAIIVNNMLNFARKSDFAVSSHHPAELLDRILDLAVSDFDIGKQYDFKKIELIKEYEDNLPLVPCERSKIQQVLLNILRNGAQAMQDGHTEKPQFFLRIKLSKEIESIIIEIEDNGPGMDDKIRRRIFEPFFTTRTVGGGTGLGLSVSYFIITENHGGKLTVESQPGEGAKFIISLPLHRNIEEM